MKYLCIGLIKIYQFMFSFDHSFWSKYVNFRICRYYPTCSEYSIQAFKKYGFFKGAYLSLKRVLRCNPFAKGGFDPLK